MISCADIHLVRPGGSPLLAGIDVRIDRGEVVAITGPNGAGKTSLARVLAGLERPTRGTVTVDGGIGYVGQDPASQLVAGTVAQDVAFALENRAVDPAQLEALVERELAAAGLTPVAWSVPQELSGGEQQRTATAGVLVDDRAVLVLDEPTSHLGARASRHVRAAIQRHAASGGCVVLVTQRPEELAWCTRVIELRAGELAFDEPVRRRLDRLARAGDEHRLPSAARFGALLARAGLVLDAVPLDEDELRRALDAAGVHS